MDTLKKVKFEIDFENLTVREYLTMEKEGKLPKEISDKLRKEFNFIYEEVLNDLLENYSIEKVKKVETIRFRVNHTENESDAELYYKVSSFVSEYEELNNVMVCRENSLCFIGPICEYNYKILGDII